jgi:flagellar basal body-associated protein FliL
MATQFTLPFSRNRFMPKTTARDRSTTYAVAFAFALLAAGFAFAWFYQARDTQLRSQTVYSKPTRVVAGSRDYSVAVSFAIQTSAADIEWAAANRAALEQVAQRVLVERDMRQALAPRGMQALQAALRDACNAALHTDKVKQVLVTDFLLASSSS